jgi:uncharacterized protein (DUF488 family)
MKRPIPKRLFSIGHSNAPLDQFLKLLRKHRIKVLTDVRRFPGSRKFPDYNQSNLAASLQEAGIEYQWMEKLGGRRGKSKITSSANLGLRNVSFRNYADYMLSKEFREELKELLKVAARKRTVIMCAEAVFWRCHRRLISDYLITRGITVEHIMPNGDLRPHSLTDGAVIEEEKVSYPEDKTMSDTSD